MQNGAAGYAENAGLILASPEEENTWGLPYVLPIFGSGYQLFCAHNVGQCDWFMMFNNPVSGVTRNIRFTSRLSVFAGAVTITLIITAVDDIPSNPPIITTLANAVDGNSVQYLVVGANVLIDLTYSAPTVANNRSTLLGYTKPPPGGVWTFRSTQLMTVPPGPINLYSNLASSMNHNKV